MRGVIPALVAMAFWGMSPILGKLGLVKVDPMLGLFFRSATVTIIITLMCLATGRFGHVAEVPVRSAAFLAIEGLLAGLVAQFAFYWALKLDDASRVVPFVAAYPLLTVAIAIAVLGEKLTMDKVVGAVLVVGGIFFLKR